MFDLDEAVGSWRRTFARERAFSRWDLDELEDHLRAAYEVELVLDPSLEPERAFGCAVATLGAPGELSVEFAKVEGRGWRWLVRAGWAVFAVSFLLPVAHYGLTLGQFDVHEGLVPGIQALLLALRGNGGAIGFLSGLTNLAMGATLWRVSDAGPVRTRLLAVLVTLGMVLNTCWFFIMDDPSDLLAGYYAWLGSFGLVGSGLWVRARALPADSADAAIAP